MLQKFKAEKWMRKEHFFLTSKRRTTGSIPAAYYEIGAGHQNVTHFGIVALRLPICQNINTSNNFFLLNDGGSNLDVELTVGSYTPAELASHLKTALDTASSISLALTFTVTYNSITHKFAVSATGNFVMRFTDSDRAKKIGIQLGYGAVNTTSSTSADPSYVADIGIPVLGLEVINVPEHSFSNMPRQSTFWITLPNDASTGENNLVEEKELSGFSAEANKVSIQQLRINLFDQWGDALGIAHDYFLHYYIRDTN